MEQEPQLRRSVTNTGATDLPGRKLLRFGILTLGVLCIVQATLNVSLRLAFYLKEDTDQLSINILSISEVCQIDQNSTQTCSCFIDVLKKLVREYKALEKERDLLRDQVKQLTTSKNPQDDGSGYLENLESSGYY
ncbi:hypothetical protein PFLUV_G00041560 [Xyrichtys novacula]|uniref:Uncharacterized protein n=1 Tax=Xyrichtys novacula TaxID=13765 RepID=A0AAV1ERW7_XYRNO|nr:hypothetical protein PFLUV_G00041560 [Xyrichtys novacula]